MKYDCGPGRGTRVARLTQWHWYYALFPVEVGDHDCRWLETVERRFLWVGVSGTPYDPEYRAVQLGEGVAHARRFWAGVAAYAVFACLAIFVIRGLI